MSEELEWRSIMVDDIIAMAFLQGAVFMHVLQKDCVSLLFRDNSSYDNERPTNMGFISSRMKMLRDLDKDELHICVNEMGQEYKRKLFVQMYMNFRVGGILNSQGLFNDVYIFNNKNNQLSLNIFLNKYNEGKEIYDTLVSLIDYAEVNTNEVVFISDRTYVRSADGYNAIRYV